MAEAEGLSSTGKGKASAENTKPWLTPSQITVGNYSHPINSKASQKCNPSHAPKPTGSSSTSAATPTKRLLDETLVTNTSKKQRTGASQSSTSLIGTSLQPIKPTAAAQSKSPKPAAAAAEGKFPPLKRTAHFYGGPIGGASARLIMPSGQQSGQQTAQAQLQPPLVDYPVSKLIVGTLHSHASLISGITKVQHAAPKQSTLPASPACQPAPSKLTTLNRSGNAPQVVPSQTKVPTPVPHTEGTKPTMKVPATKLPATKAPAKKSPTIKLSVAKLPETKVPATKPPVMQASATGPSSCGELLKPPNDLQSKATPSITQVSGTVSASSSSSTASVSASVKRLHPDFGPRHGEIAVLNKAFSNQEVKKRRTTKHPTPVSPNQLPHTVRVPSNLRYQVSPLAASNQVGVNAAIGENRESENAGANETKNGGANSNGDGKGNGNGNGDNDGDGNTLVTRWAEETNPEVA
ncbi:hypothetical protein CTheo_8780 [Ceratobasidium theobromae]|uniref:Uncharacterized protein n=1 Tax=Ceratobasidium theobromae TaxID=1582974 RepID=A0A5N5Q7W3_9AGAM|nr:hypothetical protein CTheo_8780 [Ceratobasidium theobromae]